VKTNGSGEEPTARKFQKKRGPGQKEKINLWGQAVKEVKLQKSRVDEGTLEPSEMEVGRGKGEKKKRKILRSFDGGRAH